MRYNFDEFYEPKSLHYMQAMPRMRGTEILAVDFNSFLRLANLLKNSEIRKHTPNSLPYKFVKTITMQCKFGNY
jgi:hypothetical protein